MTTHLSIAGAVVAASVGLAGLFGLVACKKAPPDDGYLAPSSVAPGPSAVPVDHTAPDEMAEGTDEAFGLKLPRYMRITARFPDSTFAQGPLAPDRVANYVRQRVIAKHVETGPAKTVFSGAEPKGTIGKTLHVEVVARPGLTEIMVRDETRPSSNDGMSPDDRMRAVGLKPDGTPLDPTHLR